MKTIFQRNQEKIVPESFEECYRQDYVSKNLFFWGNRLEKLGLVLFVIIIVFGIILSMVTALQPVQNYFGGYYYNSTEFNFGTFITSLFSYGFYAFIEYCIYHVLALLITALSSIVYSNHITAKTALFNTSKNCAHEKDADSPKEEPQA